MAFPRPGGPCLCWHSSSSSRCRMGFPCRKPPFEGSAAAAAAPSSRHRETYSKLFLGDFRRDVPAPRNAYFGLCSSFRAMVFPRPGGPCLCGHSSSSSRCRPSVAWGFLAGSRLFEGSAAPAAAAAPRSQHRETYSKLFLGNFRRDVSAPGNAYFGFHSSFRAMVFPRPAGPCLCGHSSSSSSYFLLWKLFDCSSPTAAPQQQQQPPAAAPAAGSCREQQAAAGSRRQQQAAAGSSRHQ